LDHNFNIAFCEAYNERKAAGYTHWGLHHDDITAQPDFIDVIVSEMDRVGADVLSCVIAVGDERGLTSTGIHMPGAWNARRLTLTEVYELPKTFSIDDTPWAGTEFTLAVNTGLFLARFDRPWVERFTGFSTNTTLMFDRDSDKRYPCVFPEDFAFAAWCAGEGLKVFATRAVEVTHRKPEELTNARPWGTWSCDRECAEIYRAKGGDNGNDSLASAGHDSCNR
jgi:hypothetical protein